MCNHIKFIQALGKEGKILEVDSDGDAVVLVGSDLWLMNPAALEDLTGGEGTSQRGDTSPSSPGKGLTLMFFFGVIIGCVVF